MANRTTATAVREILSTSLTQAQIDAFITDANVWVTDVLVPVNTGATAGILEIIERYLACALVRLRDLGLKSTTIKDVTEQYQADPDVTDYLLRAASFDTSGTIRQHFLAPKPVALPEPATFPAIATVGKGYTEDA